MAKNSVQRESAAPQPAAKLVDDRLWIKAQWEELKIPDGVRNRLASIDSTTYICANLASLLVDDAIRSVNADDEDGALYRPLPVDQRNSLLLAMQSLLWESMEKGDYVRNAQSAWSAEP